MLLILIRICFILCAEILEAKHAAERRISIAKDLAEHALAEYNSETDLYHGRLLLCISTLVKALDNSTRSEPTGESPESLSLEGIISEFLRQITDKNFADDIAKELSFPQKMNL